jgi:ketosteroid isomerase-like protein
MRRIVLSAFALTVLAACQPEVGPLSDEDFAAVRGIGTSYALAVSAGDADAVAALYTESATEMPPDMPAREGQAAIRAAYEAEAGVVEEFTLSPVEIDGRAGLAFDRGTWSWTGVIADTLEAVTLTGKYMVILRKQEDGSWLMTDAIWNSDAPMPQPE